MRYKFGNYEVSTHRDVGGVFTVPHYDCWIYYKNSLISESHFHYKESYALEWAKNEIETHKQSLKQLETATNV